MIRAKVLQWVVQQALFPTGSKVLAACSGGSDSLTLVDLLAGLRKHLDFSLSVAHFDHGLRGAESGRDAEYVRVFCQERGLRFFVGTADLKLEISRVGGSMEEVARNFRYGFLRQVAADLGGAWIATGHHREDQVETLLLNLIRGSGSRGLGAMRVRQADVIRPLLCLTRSEIETYCRQQKLNPQEDSSNANVEIFRNRLRHELVPLLRQRFNPSLTDTLCRTAEILNEEQDFLRQYVIKHMPGWAVRLENGYRLEGKVFSRLHAAIQRQLLMVLLEQLRGNTRNISFRHVESMRALFLQDRGSQRINLPGDLQARKSYHDLFVELVPDEAMVSKRTCISSVESTTETPLNCPGETSLPDFGITIRCSLHSGPLPTDFPLDDSRAVFDTTGIAGPFIVRRRYCGDRFHPLGAAGARKLKKILIDLKIPCELRELLPIVSDRDGILWLVGLRRSERGRVTEQTAEYILMEII